MNLGEHQIPNDRTTDHEQMRHIYGYIKRVLLRGILYHDLHKKKAGRRIDAYEANNFGDSSSLGTK